jgi:hypothetical protein
LQRLEADLRHGRIRAPMGRDLPDSDAWRTTP